MVLHIEGDRANLCHQRRRLGDLATLDSPEARQEAMKGAVEDCDRESIGGTASLPSARDGRADEVWAEVGRFLR